MSNLTTSIQLTKQSTYKLNNGQHIPIAGFGTYLIEASKTTDLVYQALKDGYRHIDTAMVYGNEKEAAEGIAKFLKDHSDIKREDIWFTTKIFNQYQGYDRTKEAVEIISKDVKQYIDYVDLILIHSPKTSKDKRLGTWKALQEYVLNPNNDTLNIHSIGVSNYGIDHLEELFNWEGYLIKPVVDQLELHPWLPRLKLREYLVKHDILAEAYSPITQGQKLNDPELLKLSEKFKVSPVEILLKWSYLQGFIVLVKTEKPSRIKENLNVLPDGHKNGDDDELEEKIHLGKIDLEPEIIEALNLPDSKEVLTWGGKDPALFKDGDA
ncbi:uncharacterized protein KGF55_001496 [Candida pseudojiufengensis]|uniref:uncharacterized protein n=1 Tax=Candida pseudojiufengensis TaxID=497109 RepID=UPI002224A772|nr:uncharacterized protein KGF55_001496 [Candida pseudojiufengensis]KAI5965276.1 hypothetical protein KGF55_001496 [Candida pseudojiufengensis]